MKIIDAVNTVSVLVKKVREVAQLKVLQGPKFINKTSFDKMETQGSSHLGHFL